MSLPRRTGEDRHRGSRAGRCSVGRGQLRRSKERDWQGSTGGLRKVFCAGAICSTRQLYDVTM